MRRPESQDHTSGKSARTACSCSRYARRAPGHRRMQFTVDRKTKRSYIELHELEAMDALSFKSHYDRE